MDGLIVLCEVHVTVSALMVDEQGVVVIDWIALMLVAAVRFYTE